MIHTRRQRPQRCELTRFDPSLGTLIVARLAVGAADDLVESLEEDIRTSVREVAGLLHARARDHPSRE